MSFAFHPEAEEEFNAAIEYYEEIEPGLGYDFAIEVHSTIQRSVNYPKSNSEEQFRGQYTQFRPVKIILSSTLSN